MDALEFNRSLSVFQKAEEREEGEEGEEREEGEEGKEREEGEEREA